MTDRDTQQEGFKGAVENIKGRVKETAGALFGRDDTQREGRAQQEKGEAQQEVAERQTQAEQARQDAHLAEQRERHSQ